MLPGAQLHLFDADPQHASLLQKHLALDGQQLTCFATVEQLQAALMLEQPEILLLVPPVEQLHSPDCLDLLRVDHPLLTVLVLLD